MGAGAEKVVRQKWRPLKAPMDERARRLWAGAIGWGGVEAVARATGMTISTVRKGRDEARAGATPEDVVKVRRSADARGETRMVSLAHATGTWRHIANEQFRGFAEVWTLQ